MSSWDSEWKVPTAELVDGYACPTDPAELDACEGCQ